MVNNDIVINSSKLNTRNFVTNYKLTNSWCQISFWAYWYIGVCNTVRL